MSTIRFWVFDGSYFDGPNDWTLDLSDSVTASESAAFGVSVAKSDAVTVSDTWSAGPGIVRQDTAAVSDAVRAVDEVALGDSVALSDFVITEMAYERSLSDAALVADTDTEALGLTLDLSDAVSVADEVVTDAQAAPTVGGVTPFLAESRSTRHLRLRIEDRVWTDEQIACEQGLRLADLVRTNDGDLDDLHETSRAGELVTELEDLALLLADDPDVFALFAGDTMDRLRDPERTGRDLVLSGQR